MRIRKFNESLEEIDTNYIDECFVDFIDRGFKFEREEEVYCISIPAVKSSTYRDFESNNDNKILNILDKAKEIVLESQICIEKVKIKYPNIEYTIVFGDDTHTRNFDIDVIFILEE